MFVRRRRRGQGVEVPERISRYSEARVAKGIEKLLGW
jgi:hypothetical protein